MLGVRAAVAAVVLLGFALSARSVPAVKTIAAGGSHDLALLSDGTVWAWGHNDYGQLDDGTFSTRPAPLTDVLPPGLIYAYADAPDLSCTAAERTISCTNPNPIGPGLSSTIDLTVEVGPAAFPGVTDLATVSNISDRNPSNNNIGDHTVVQVRVKP